MSRYKTQKEPKNETVVIIKCVVIKPRNETVGNIKYVKSVSFVFFKIFNSIESILIPCCMVTIRRIALTITSVDRDPRLHPGVQLKSQLRMFQLCTQIIPSYKIWISITLNPPHAIEQVKNMCTGLHSIS